MRVLCPHCQQSVTVPESAAGRPTPCPHCGQTLTPPALTGAAIDAAPEPAPNPPAPFPKREGGEKSKEAIGGSPPSLLGKGAGGLGSSAAPWLHLTLRRDVAHWLAPAALLLALVLTFFTWVAVAPNGTRVYTQNAWQAAGGTFSTDPLGERVMQSETELKDRGGWSVALLFYLILLLPTVAVAIADRVLARNPATIPDVFRPVWPHRQLIVAGLCAALLLLLILPLTFGFGLESAVRATAEAAVAQPQPAAGKVDVSTTDKTERDLRRDVKVASYGLTRTAWLALALVAQVVALVGAGLARWLDRHPAAPDPRLEVYC